MGLPSAAQRLLDLQMEAGRLRHLLALKEAEIAARTAVVTELTRQDALRIVHGGGARPAPLEVRVVFWWC